LYEFYGPEVTLTGTSSFGGLPLIDAAAIDDASLTMGAGYPTSFLVNTVTNSNIQAFYVSYIKSNNWLNTDGGSYNLSAQSIDYLDVPTTFAENLDLQGKNYDLILGKLGQVSGTWDLSGSMYKTTLSTSPTTGWSLSAQGVIASLGIKGNLENTIVAAAIDKFSVSGTTTDSTIETDATFGAKYKLIGSLSFKGAVSNTVVFSTGNVGTITAPSFTNSRVYAGVEVSVAQNGALAASASDLSANASIGSITLGAFSDGLISADIIGSLKLGKIDTSNNGTPEGVSAHKISSVSGILTPGGTLRAGAAQLKSAAALAAYEKAEKLTLGDFEINLF